MQPSKSILVTLCFCVLLLGPLAMAAEPGSTPLPEIVARASAGDLDASRDLRRLGLAGVEALLAAEPPDHRSNGDRQRWEQAVDRVCAQRDCVHSRLFWHTDLEMALAEARQSDRPVLSLRLLGRLDEELSCANSRFFRLLLYPDPRIADLMRQRFVLHWSSERPAPTVRIDFGDGRALAGTLTGNSIHYVLDTRGRVVDALPGLYGPGRFIERLSQAADLADGLDALDDVEFSEHRAIAHAVGPGAWAAPRDPSPPQPTARQAGELAVSKAAVEMPILDAISFPGSSSDRSALPRHAERDRADWALSDASEALLREALSRMRPAEADRMLDRFLDALAEDSWRNDRFLRPVIRSWLQEPEAPLDLEALNTLVYNDLFLTPASDPWLGLRSIETFLALSGIAPEPRGASLASVDTSR